MDVVGDFITILRNASAARKARCTVPWSALRAGIASILKEMGYIKDFARKDLENGHVVLHVSLKYVDGVPAIREIGRIGRPGCRRYTSRHRIPPILGGMGECVLSTSKGVLSGREARRLGLGGELMCYVF